MTGIAHAAGTTPAMGAGGFGQFIPLILIFVIFYFLLIRPQQKKAKEHQEFLSALKKGANVVTNGGVHGKITGLTDSIVTLEVDTNVRLKINRASIQILAEDAKKQAASTTKGGG